MPILRPTNINDSITLIQEYEKEILKGSYEIVLPKCDISLLPELTQLIICKAKNSLDAQLFLASESTLFSTLKILSKSENSRVRAMVAGNKHTSINLIELLAKEDDESVLYAIALNSNTPLNILEDLFKVTKFIEYSGEHIPIPGLSKYIASNPNTSTNLLQKIIDRINGTRNDYLGIDKLCVDVVIKHPNFSIPLLLDSQASFVIYFICRNYETIPEMLTALVQHSGLDEYAKQLISQNPNTNSIALALLSKDSNLAIREFVAIHKNTSIETLQFLSKDKIETVRIAVVRNPNTPNTIIEILTKDISKPVRNSAHDRRNPNRLKFDINLQNVGSGVLSLGERLLKGLGATFAGAYFGGMIGLVLGFGKFILTLSKPSNGTMGDWISSSFMQGISVAFWCVIVSSILGFIFGFLTGKTLRK